MNVGGIANYILTLSEALKARGASCMVASSGGNLEVELARRLIPHRYLNIRTKSEFSPKVFRSIFDIAGIIKDEKIDIVHAHTRVSQAAVFFSSRITGVPYVTTCHGFFKKRLRKIFDTWGRRVIAISDAVDEHLEEDLGVEEGRIALIYNGVDAARFEKELPAGEIEDARRSIGLNGGPVIGTIGRLSPVKGQKYLIEAMAMVLSKRKDARLVMVGDGPEEAALKDLAGSLGIGSSVRFIGSTFDTRRLLSVMDIFVLPSVKEGLGIALLEALASGKCCIASDVGGIGNVIRNGVNGILVPSGDSTSLAREILRLSDDAALRKAMGISGREVVKSRFSLDSMADKIMALYEEAL